jgi:hypothetical protein
LAIIVYELNEVPKKLFEFYGDAFPKSCFAFLNKHSHLFQTKTADVGNLSPWITWPTMHRGVPNIDHEISELGQDLTYINKEFPSLYQLLADSGLKVGVFGCLQSYPLPDNLDNYSFYIPDTFAAGDECYPEKLSLFQSFNLSMVRANGRNVSKGITAKDAATFMSMSKGLGLSFNTLGKLALQISLEQINKDRVVRRRTSQAQISFDLFFKQLVEKKPDISFFFTNHVASSMHRYWPTIFPSDYEDGKFEKDWMVRWKNEIPHAVKVANEQLSKLVNYCNATKTELILCSSMGQDAVSDVVPIDKQVLITNIKKFLNFLGIEESDWEPRLSMAPRVVVKPLNERFFLKLNNLNRILVNNNKIDYVITSTGDVRFSIELCNQDSLYVTNDGIHIPYKIMGIENVNLQDASGSYAYHVPEGILLHYSPFTLKTRNDELRWADISVLDFAPSLLAKFNVPVPQYMRGERFLYGH